MLTEGAEAALIAALREAAADGEVATAEIDRAEEFAGRFPGWAEVLVHGHRRIASLERTVETLSDRLTHDPHLAASVHEVLSTAASIRSTASILAETGELEAEWRDRFHRNLNQDSRRLAESSRALVTYLDDNTAGDDPRGVPREEAEAFLAAQGYHFPGLERGEAAVEDVLKDAAAPRSAAARAIVREILQQYCADAAALPLEKFAAPDRDDARDGAAGWRRPGHLRPVGRDAVPQAGRGICDAEIRRALSAVAAVPGAEPAVGAGAPAGGAAGPGGGAI